MKMRFTRGTYTGSPCWQFISKAGRVVVHADWNTRPPYGTSLSIYGASLSMTPGFLLDLNAPLGEPNRLYLQLGRWRVTFGLLSVRDLDGHGDWLHPHIDGIDRYRYHWEAGRLVRNASPEPMHWGWLTIEKKGGFR